MQNVVVIGYGSAGRRFHSYLVRLAPGLRLAGVSSRNAQTRTRIQEEQGVRAYAGLDEVLADPEVDLVVLATPHDVHADQVVRCLEAGKHVVTDKVMALTVAEVDRMIAARDASGKMLSVFHNRRWDGDYQTVRQVIEAGLLGDAFAIEVCILRYGPQRGWRAQASHGGGMLYDWGAHFVDQAVQIFGPDVDRVYCTMQHGHWDMDVESHSQTVIRFAGGQTYTIVLSNLSRIEKPRWFVMGTKGTLVKTGLDPQEAAMIAEDIDSAKEDPAHYARVKTEAAGRPAEMAIETLPGRWRSYYENIAAHLNEGAELAVTAESCRVPIAIQEAARRSVASGDAEPLPG